MADDEEDLTPREKLQQRHKKEKKELQAKIQSLKHAVPKGDKKRKKEMLVEVAQLEAELNERHKKEEDELQKSATTEDEKISEDVSEITSETANLKVTEDKQPRVSKAQRRKEKKEAEERERQKRIAEAELENVNSARNIENNKFENILKSKGLCVKEVAADGNCLYNAVADQLNSQIDNKLTYHFGELRRLTAGYMRTHPEEFLPFLIHPESGNLYTEEEFANYCRDLESTAVWGGQLEIKALSQVLLRPIKVFQADAPVMVIGEEHSDQETVNLSYHLHAFGSGEHYNSVVLAVEETDDGF